MFASWSHNLKLGHLLTQTNEKMKHEEKNEQSAAACLDFWSICKAKIL